jgi:hypothetical protein
MISVVEGVRKRIKQYSPKVVVNRTVCPAMFLNVENVRIENRYETLTESFMPLFVIPASGCGRIVEDSREKTELAHPRVAFIRC